MRLTNIAIALLLLPASAQAQRLAETRTAVRAVSVDSQAPPSRTRVVLVRTLTGAVGATVGAFAGYGAGNLIKPAGRDVVLSDEEAIGMAIGAVIGAAIGVAAKRYESECSWRNRFVRAIPGAALGFIPGVVLGPFGLGLGGALAQGRC
jgi:hypothetical protein